MYRKEFQSVDTNFEYFIFVFIDFHNIKYYSFSFMNH